MEKDPCPGRRAARKEDRRRAILKVAERSFFDRGFADTSMSTIAAELGGSKTTLWSYFPSKEALFAAVLDCKIADFASALDQALISTGGAAGVLHRFGQIFLAKILSEDSRRLQRLIASEGDRFPAMSDAYYQRGPARVSQRLALYLSREMAAGRLREGDAAMAARQFLALCQAGAYNDRVWHRLRPDSDPERDVEQAVDTFLRAWRAESPPPPAR